MKLKKFATQLEEKTIRDLKLFSKKTDKSISKVVNLAIIEYLQKTQVRPAFRNAMEEVIEENAQLLKKLAE